MSLSVRYLFNSSKELIADANALINVLCDSDT